MKRKIIRITTVPISLKVLLKGQLKYLNEKYDVVAVSSYGKELDEVAEREGVRVCAIEMTRTISPLKDIVSIYLLYRFLRKERPYVVHTHTPKAGFVGIIAAFFARVPYRVHTVAGLPLMETRGIKRRLLLFVERLTYCLANYVLPNSYVLKKFILDNGLASESKLKVLGAGSSNGIDLNYFNRSSLIEEDARIVKERYGLVGKFVFLFIGRIVGQKGVNELISAFVDVNNKFPNTVLLLVGNIEEDLDPLDKETKAKLSSNSILWLGYQSDVRVFLELADVFVFPSYREGFPNVVLQACAFNLPCIVTDIGGSNEIIQNGENGIVIPVKNVAALLDAMCLMYSNPELRGRFARINRKRIMDNYDQRYIWNNLECFYNSLK